MASSALSFSALMLFHGNRFCVWGKMDVLKIKSSPLSCQTKLSCWITVSN